MLVPSSNTCLEPTTYRLLQGRGDVTVHFARLPVTRIALDDDSDGQFSTDAMTAAAEQLADAHVDVVAWNGTAGSWLGPEHDRHLVEQLEKVTGARATTSTLAMLEACRVYGVSELGVATPYTPDVNDLIAATYAREGITVVAESHLGISDNEAFGRVPPEDVARQLREVAGDTHAVAVLCTNVHGAPVVEAVEEELGRPVFDSVAATLWHSLCLSGRSEPVHGWGTLLRDGFVRAELQDICEDLLEGTGADRTTVRLDVPAHDLGVDLTAGEALRDGVRPIRREGSLDQRRLNTIEWLEAERRNLVQPDFHGDPMPPQALIEVYGVNAQMLGPVEHAGAMLGWLSAHSMSERSWPPETQTAMDQARRRVEDLVTRVSGTEEGTR
jgi:maleate isomerase